MSRQPMFNSLTNLPKKANTEQPVYVDIYYITPTKNFSEFETFCQFLVSDIKEIETSGRIFKNNALFDLNWKLNLYKMSNDQLNNLKKYNKLELKY